MARRMVFLWFPTLPTDRLRRSRRPAGGPADETGGGPGGTRGLAVCVEERGRQVLYALDAAAHGAGLRPGQSLADALSRVPVLSTVPADVAGDAALLRTLARWCWRFSPLVATDGRDGLWLDVTGCAHLFGGEAMMMADLAGRLRRMGLAVRFAVADTPGAAWALARFGDGQARVPAGRGRAALKDLPMVALRLDADTVSGLDRVGLRRVGDLAGIARASLASRFGRGVLARLDQATGEVDEPLAYLSPARPWRVRHAFAEPVGHVDILARALDGLLARLCARLADEDKGCRRLDLTCVRVDGSRTGVRVGTVRPVRDPARLARLFAEKWGGLDAGFGIETLLLDAPVVEDLAPRQTGGGDGFSGPGSGPGAAGDGAAAAALADRLANRLGPERVARAQAVDRHQPEQAWRPVGVGAPAGGWDLAGRTPPRPLRLLDRPAPLAPLGPPLGGRLGDPPRRFAVGVVQHDIRMAQGPERIAPEWWRRNKNWTGGDRDYWRIESQSGIRLWIYREVRENRWFLHGLYG